MAKVSRTITGFYGGVSQQAPWVRLESQHEEIINCFCGVVRGLEKRPGTKFEADLTAIMANADNFTAFMHISQGEVFKIFLTGDATEPVIIMDSDNNKQTVNLSASTVSYLTTTDPREYLRVNPVYDTFFIVNQNVTPAMKSTLVSYTYPTGYSGVQNIGTVAELPTKGDLDDIWASASGSLVYCVDAQEDSYTSAPFYLECTTNNEHFTECAAPGITYEIDASTMPIRLIRTSSNTWEDLPISWGERTVGDDDTNPIPSFVGSGIVDMEFFKNRLWFLLEDGIICSRALDYFNFFATSTTEVLDDDPIDLPINGSRPGAMKYMGMYYEKLLLFGEHEQFSVYSGDDDALTPKTIILSPTLKFNVCDRANILGIGASMFFLEPKVESIGVREMMIEPEILTEDAANLNIHVPSYIPYTAGDRLKLEGTIASDILFLYTESDPNGLYVYQYKWESDTKAQSAWHRWEFDSEIEDFFLWENTLFFIMKVGGRRIFESLVIDESFKTNGLDRARLDRRCLVSGGIYYETTHQTLFTLPYTDNVNTAYKGVSVDTGFTVNGTISDGNIFAVTGDYSDSSIIVGIPYTSQAQLTQFLIKPQNSVANIDEDLVLDTLMTAHGPSGFYRLRCEFSDGRSVSSEYTASTIGRSVAGEPEISRGTCALHINAKVTDITVFIESESHLPMEVILGEYRGDYNRKYQRI